MAQGMVPRGRLYGGLLLIALGLLFLLDELGMIRIGETLATWWPSFLIILGLLQISCSYPRHRTSGFILVILGVLFQIDNLNLFPWWSIDRLWPVLLILLGLWILAGRAWRSSPQAALSGTGDLADTVNTFAPFRGSRRALTSQQFRGGEAHAVFGGIELDLRGARLAPGEQRLDLSAVFAGIAVRVPDRWQVMLEGSPIFGHIRDDRRSAVTAAAPPADPTASSLRIRAEAVFGSVELQS